MTNATIALTLLAEKGADVDVLRQMVQFMAQRFMKLDVEARRGAGYDEKSPQRFNSHNGDRERAWDARADSLALNDSQTALGLSLHARKSMIYIRKKPRGVYP
jgi:putative transposase